MIDRIFVPLRKAISLGDVIMASILAAVVYAVIHAASEWTGIYKPVVEISLSPGALPGYAMFSIVRGFVAYGISLVFALCMGYLAAKSARLEKILLPILDILQSIPVLGFLPGLVLGLVSIFPTSNVGLELAAIIMIFTSQAWNMVFAFYASLKGMPKELSEVAMIYRFSWWKKFISVDVAYSAVPLVWNSMVSMAGGWFFLMVAEAFTLGKNDFRLPGIGAYMSVAYERGDTSAVTYGILTMIAVIVIIDQLLWKPMIVTAQRFRFEKFTGDASRSTILGLVSASRLTGFISYYLTFPLSWLAGVIGALGKTIPSPTARVQNTTRRIALWLFIAIGIGTAVWGAISLMRLLSGLSASNWSIVGEATVASFIRTMAATLVGALWTIPAGFAIGLRPRLAKRLQPVIQVAASFPAPMIFPLVFIALAPLGVPLSITSSVLMILGTQWYILFNTIAGVTGIPRELIDVARMSGMNGWNKWRNFYLPAIFPSLVTGLVSALGGAWNMSIVTEYLQVKTETHTTLGLGALISVSTEQGNFALLAASVVAMCVVVVLFNRLVWQKLYSKAEEKYSLTN